MQLALTLVAWTAATVVVGVPVGRFLWVWLRPTNVAVGTPRTYRGHYLAHWEVANFVFDTGRRYLWLWPVRERWGLIFPDGYELPWSTRFGGKPTGRMNGRRFEIEFVGVPGRRGWFGHRGIWDREVVVERIISATEVPCRGPVL